MDVIGSESLILKFPKYRLWYISKIDVAQNIGEEIEAYLVVSDKGHIPVMNLLNDLCTLSILLRNLFWIRLHSCEFP